MRTTFRTIGGAQQLDDILFRLKSVKELTDALEIFCCRNVLQKIALAAHDQTFPVVGYARPFGKTSLDDLLSKLIELSLGSAQRFLDLALGLSQRHAAEVGIEIVRGFLQSRRRQSFRERYDAVLDVLILINEDHKAAARL